MNTMIFRKIISGVMLLLLCGLWSCKTHTKIANEYATSGFNVECIGIDPSGWLMLRSWGNGINKDKAIEQAKRRAVETVVFSGITSNNDSYKRRPLVTEVNARERHEDYFDSFFADGGAFNDYVKLEEKRTSRIKSANSSMEAWGVVVIVNRSGLKQHLEAANIIKK